MHLGLRHRLQPDRTNQRLWRQWLLRSTDFELTGFIRELTFGLSACSVKTITLNVGGTARTETPNGGTTTLDLRDSHATVSFAVISGTCQPAMARMTFNGDAHITDVSMSPAFDLASTFADLSVVRNPIANSGASISGEVAANCFGGSVAVMSRGIIVPGTTGRCPASGALDISARGPHTIARYAVDGSVQVDRSVDGTVDETFPSCLVSLPCTP